MGVRTIGLARLKVGLNTVLLCQVANTNGHPNLTFRPRDEAGDDDLEVGGDLCVLDLDLSFLPLL